MPQNMTRVLPDTPKGRAAAKATRAGGQKVRMQKVVGKAAASKPKRSKKKGY